MVSIGNITFACRDPGGLAEFWAARHSTTGSKRHRLAYSRRPKLKATTPMRLRLFFRKMPRSSPEHIPIHLDRDVEDREAEVDQLTELGVTVVETKTETNGPYTETWTGMRDPEGNGFCVQSPNR